MSNFNIADFGPCACPLKNYRTGEIMAHWRSMVETKYLSHFDLQGKACNVQIVGVKKSEVIGSGGVKNQKAVLRYQGKEKGMVAGVTVLSTIASLYGDDTDGWVGKWITIYPATTEASGRTVGTIRVKPTAPNGPTAAKAREPGADDGGTP